MCQLGQGFLEEGTCSIRAEEAGPRKDSGAQLGRRVAGEGKWFSVGATKALAQGPCRLSDASRAMCEWEEGETHTLAPARGDPGPAPPLPAGTGGRSPHWDTV